MEGMSYEQSKGVKLNRITYRGCSYFNRHKYRVKKFHEWQQYMNDQAYVVPLTNSYSIMAINDKLTGYSLQPSKSNGNGFPNWYYVAYKK